MVVSSGGECGTGVTAAIVPDKWAIPGRHASFEDACREHDKCYDYQEGKDLCDETFKGQLLSSCDSTFKSIAFRVQKTECRKLITNYYFALVQKAGKTA